MLTALTGHLQKFWRPVIYDGELVSLLVKEGFIFFMVRAALDALDWGAYFEGVFDTLSELGGAIQGCTLGGEIMWVPIDSPNRTQKKRVIYVSVEETYFGSSGFREPYDFFLQFQSKFLVEIFSVEHDFSFSFFEHCSQLLPDWPWYNPAQRQGHPCDPGRRRVDQTVQRMRKWPPEVHVVIKGNQSFERRLRKSTHLRSWDAWCPGRARVQGGNRIVSQILGTFLGKTGQNFYRQTGHHEEPGQFILNTHFPFQLFAVSGTLTFLSAAARVSKDKNSPQNCSQWPFISVVMLVYNNEFELFGGVWLKMDYGTCKEARMKKERIINLGSEQSSNEVRCLIL
ncbi:hypothetical protein VP01_2196g1 [Puccinia sorghi]|uniref:Uncharacterized protein n=1 Tax=Puccinia sorghi TaxID=27349 RepID=A0A0L6V9N2_9BASI|nr:hypothetical protein VP01_2196g1 [Puccinia sorghi]